MAETISIGRAREKPTDQTTPIDRRDLKLIVESIAIGRSEQKRFD